MKNFFKNLKVADYWHVEVFAAIPIVIVWTVLLVGIYLNTK